MEYDKDMIAALYLSKIADGNWHKALVEEIWKKGYVILPGFLDNAAFAALKSYALSISGTGEKSNKMGGTMGHEIARSEEFMALFNGLYRVRREKEGLPYEPLSLERQVVGYPYKDAREGKKTQETEYHYDGAYVNATLALVMPSRGGELIAFPNLRTGKNALSIKLVSRALRHVPFLRRVVPHVVVRTTPNDLCLFFGDRTFHGVEPISEGERLIMTINNHW